MRYPLLATALSLVFGSSLALADNSADPQQQKPPEQTSSSETQYDTSKTETMTIEETTDTTKDTTKSVQNVNLFFDTNSADLAATATSDLQKLATWAKCSDKNAIILEGFADPRGTQKHNMKLSGERAAMVRQKLLDLGVPSKRIVVTVYGENGPRKKNFQQERRVTARATPAPIVPSDLPT